MDKQYLQKRGNTWLVVVEVPKALRERVGKPRFMKSLGTDSLLKANRLKLPYVSEWHRQIEEASNGKADPLAPVFKEALDNLAAFRAPGERLEQRDEDFNSGEEDMSLVLERAKELLERHGRTVSDTYLAISTGKATLIKDTYPLWLAQFDGTGQTKMQHETAVKRYLAWEGAALALEGVTRKKAGEYVNALLATSGLSKRTIQRHCSSLSSLWAWYVARGHVESEQNPWRGHGLGKKPKGAKPYRKAYTDDLIVTLLGAPYGKRYKETLPDLIRLALLTGTRLEVFCAMKKTCVERREDGYWVTIEDDKTEAGTRTVPLHSAANAIIERRMADEGDYLFADLIPGGPDRKRSWFVGKMFRYHKRKAGVVEKGQDFHAFRNTFIAVMEGLEVAESTVKLLVGHKRASLTYGHYSQGERVKLRAAIERLDYGAQIMSLISASGCGGCQ